MAAKVHFFQTRGNKKAVTICNGFQKLIKEPNNAIGLGCHGFVVEVGGLADEGVHHAGIDLCGGGVIDKGDGSAVVVGDGLAGAGLHVLADFRAAIGIAEHVDVAVVETGEDDDFGVHHRSREVWT